MYFFSSMLTSECYLLLILELLRKNYDADFLSVSLEDCCKMMVIIGNVFKRLFEFVIIGI